MTAAGKPTLFRALGDKRMAAILFLSFASGLPLNLTVNALQAWLATYHVNIKTIGLFNLVGLPYVFKFMWAPLLDRYAPPQLGRRRGWIVVFQIALAAAIAVMSYCSPLNALYLLAAMALLVASLSASQDIVIDAYRVDVIPAAERSVAASVSQFGYRAGALFVSAAIVSMAGFLGWQRAYLLVAAIMLATVLATLRAPEPDVPGRPPRTLEDAVVKPFQDFLSRQGAWGFLLLVLLYKVGDAFALSLYSAFMLNGVGISLYTLGVAKIDMTVSTMVGIAFGGWMYLRWGMFRSLLIFGIGQACTNLLYMALALAGNKLWLVLLATSLDTCVGGMGQAAFIAFLVAQCSASFSATQYALLSALAAVPRVLVGGIAGHVVARVGWANFFVVTVVTAIPGLALLVALRRRINVLESHEAASAGA